ncbi:protein arv1 homolog isoform X2 [Phalaenopsis equestris]|nr:protein arv1 homolog isoform X2 [Phalaenopsis equestris]
MIPFTEAREQKHDGFRCVNCGRRVGRLFMQYSPGNIRLMKCDNCKAVADPYIECEFMIIFIDLILHKPKAFRHLLYNVLNLEKTDFKAIALKLALMYFILDAYRVSLSVGSKGTRVSSRSGLEFAWTCLKVLLNVLLGNLMLVSVLWIGIRILLNLNYHICRYREILLAVLVSSYFKMFLLAMMVWDFPSASIFIVDIFVLSLNTVALRVLTQLGTTACFLLCFSSHGAKFIASDWLLLL